MIGESAVAFDWRERTSGGSVYVGDVVLPGMCHAAIVRSPHAHADITRIDSTRACVVPGVLLVLTGEDFGSVTYRHHGGPLADRPPLARGRVRFIGEEVAVVVAETQAAACDGARAVEVSYRRRRAVTTVQQALHSTSPSLHDRAAGHNVSLHMQRTLGAPPEPGEAEVVVTGSYRFARQAHVSMETNGTVASWDRESEQLHVWSSTQSPYFVRKELAHVLGLDMEKVVAHEVAVGGGFGAKSKICEHEALAALASIRLGKPVRLLLSREEEFFATKSRHEFHTELTTTADAEGRITGHHARVLVDNGAYNHTGPSVMGAGMAILASQYRTDGVRIDARLVDTNKVPGGQFRGYGGPQATFAVECQMDELAEQLGIDPIDLRLRNLHEPGATSHAGLRFATTQLAACLERVREAIDWDTRRADGGSGRGVGVAIGVHPSGARTYPDANRSAARIDVAASGEVTVRFGGADPGTGQRVILAQVASEELGIDIESIRVTMMDTDETPTDMGAWSSRGTMMGGTAVASASRAAADELRARAAEKFGVDPTDVRLRGGYAEVGDDRVLVGDLVTLAGDGSGMLSVEREIEVDSDLVDPGTGVANISTAYAFAAHAVAVEVDEGTGEVTVVDYVAAHDIGRALNPTLVEGQVVGAVAMGIGAALREELLQEAGRTVNPSYLHYPLPRASDLPPIRVELIEVPDPAGPYGAKSVGEIGIVPVAAAVANAVAHATGHRVREIPITPDRILSSPQPSLLERVRVHRLWRRPGRWWIGLMRALYPRGLHHVLHRYGPVRHDARHPATAIEEVHVVDSVAAAQAALTAGAAQILAGGTDVVPARRQGFGGPSRLVDISRVGELSQVTTTSGRVRIGAAVTLEELIEQAGLHGVELLAEAAGTIASPQIRAVATVAGNLCQDKRCWFYRNGFDCYKRSGVARPCYAVLGDNRFHHAVVDAHRCQAVGPSDLATVLLALDARITVRSSSGSRQYPVDGFYRGPGETVLDLNDIITHVDVPLRQGGTSFQKLALTSGDFAVASAATWLRLEDRRVAEARIVLGGVGPAPVRVERVERVLLGARPEEGLVSSAAAAWEADAHPLEQNRWKVQAATTLISRSVLVAAGRARTGGEG